MKEIKVQWYEVLRRDGKKQYATKHGKDYFLGGSGFGIRKFDAISVTPVEDIPIKYEEGYMHCDCPGVFRGIHNANVYWNGWACPWIYADQKKELIEWMSQEPNKVTELPDGNLQMVDTDYPEEEPQIIEKVMVLGKEAYYLGNIGWTFMVMDEEQYQEYKKHNKDETDGQE